jgi:hypothetical protein
MRGTGTFADLLDTRFRIACKQLGIAHREYAGHLDTSLFRVPPAPGDQFSLF